LFLLSLSIQRSKALAPIISAPFIGGEYLFYHERANLDGACRCTPGLWLHSPVPCSPINLNPSSVPLMQGLSDSSTASSDDTDTANASSPPSATSTCAQQHQECLGQRKVSSTAPISAPPHIPLCAAVCINHNKTRSQMLPLGSTEMKAFHSELALTVLSH